MQKQFKRYLVTCALPYANGPIHIGHLAGVYIPADIYVRHLRLKKRDVLFICGSDEHGVPITIRALQENKSPKEIVDYYHNLNKEAFEKFGISFDIYSRTTSPVHYQTASEFFLKLYEKGFLYEIETEQYFDPVLNQFLADRYIIGICKKCGYDSAYGDQCEKCGSSLTVNDLIEPRSVLTKSKLELRKTKHWFLALDKFQEKIYKWIIEEHSDWKINVYGQCKSWLDEGLKPRAVTRDLNWGVPVPLPNAEGKVLYVWFDAPIGYISATKELTSNWELYWKDPETKLVHFIGKDNIVFHCIIFPIMLMAEGSYILPDNVPANEFLNLEGNKISTSKNWAVWLNDYLNDFPNKQDVLRYVLTSIMPETKDNDFSWKDFQAKNNNELVATLGNFVNRTLSLIDRYFENKIPACSFLDDYDYSILHKIKLQKEKIDENIENFKFREALKEYMEIARIGNKYINEKEPWNTIKTDIEKTKTTLAVCAELCAALAILGKPFLPFTSDKLTQMLNLQEKLEFDDIGNIPFFKANHSLNKAKLLFEKINDEEIKFQIDKLYKYKEENNSEDKALIDITDFEKVDLRVATVLSAERVANTNKLLKVTLKVGNEQKIVVAGIGEYYSPDDIIGKQVCYVKNLKPKKIKGIQSEGMILACNANNKLVLIIPERNVNDGSIIK